MKVLVGFITLILSSSLAFANYLTPNTGVKWNLSDLAANAGSNFTAETGYYNLNVTIIISTNDTLYITTNETVRFFTSTYLAVNGTIIIDPPTEVLFTAQDFTARYLGLWLDLANPNSVIRKLTVEYANSLRLTDSSPLIDQCVFRYNSSLSTFGNAAISLFRSKAIITNSLFFNNMRAAISGGANISNAPYIENCTFVGNNTLNGNVPQINLGATGLDTARILNNQILRASTNSGGIGFLPIGDARVVISGNTIRNNRYGITLNGLSNINSLIINNVIDSNNTQNNPNLGGSGIAFSGGATGAGQNSIVSGNIFRFNLWGITIQGASQPNIGNLTNAEVLDDGGNWFINNTNATTPGIDLYNNSPYNIWAQNNYWSSDDPVVVEGKIFHQPDNATLGLVNYSSFITIPVRLTRFTAVKTRSGNLLNWETETESNSDRFVIEKSINAVQFNAIGEVAAAGNSTDVRRYSFTDNDNSPVVYYRIRQVDRDGKMQHSPVAVIRDNNKFLAAIRGNRSTGYYLSLESSMDENVQLVAFASDGKRIFSKNVAIRQGSNSILVPELHQINPGIYYLKIISPSINSSLSFSSAN